VSSIHHGHLARALLAVFICLAILYSVLNPVFEAPDEVFHYPYIKHLADGNGLPVQRPEQHDLWEQEGSQPPLYYALAALLTFWIDTDDMAAVRTLNPHARIGIPMAGDNKNMIVHTEAERWPWRGTTLALRLIRFSSVLLGACTLWCTYLLGRSLFREWPMVALGAMTINALNPMFLFISGSVNNDNLVILLASLSLLLMVRMVQGEERPWSPWALGGLIGLACLSKLSGLVLIPMSALALAIAHARKAGGRLRGWALLRHAGVSVARDGLKVLAPALLIAGWWYARNLRLYGDPTGLRTMLDVFGRRTNAPSLEALLGEFEGFRISFWGLFGVVNVLLRPLWIYRLLDGVTVVGLFGAARWLWRAARSGMALDWAGLGLAAAWVLAVLAALARWTAMTKASQGRLIFPAIGPICLLLSLGLLSWLHERYWPYALGALTLGMGLLATTSPLAAIRDAYRRPEIITVADVPASAAPFLATYGGAMRLLAHEVDPAPVQPGGSVSVTLYWQSLAVMDEDLSIYIHLFGRDGRKLGQRDTYPGGGMYPTSQWQPGDVIRDTYGVPVKEAPDGPVAAEVEVGLYRRTSMAPLAVTDPQGAPVGRPVIGRVKIAAPTRPCEPPTRLDVHLGGLVTLVGHDLVPQELAPGQELPITLCWRVTAPLGRDYHVFVHLLAEDGTLAGQGDGPPLGNAYPTSFWAPGETLRDTHVLRVSEGAVPGRARLYVGLYDLATGERLAARGPGGVAEGNRVLLGEVSIGAASSARGLPRVAVVTP